MRDKGKAILLISADLDELLSLSDRIYDKKWNNCSRIKSKCSQQRRSWRVYVRGKE